MNEPTESHISEAVLYVCVYIYVIARVKWNLAASGADVAHKCNIQPDSTFTSAIMCSFYHN